ncbi:MULTISPECIES: hypothetical protein [Frankia]|uniref:hypothetical protein n=1 Tax=Frankia TaxID=1854 RepID=UPI001E40ADFF|nr:MULTISPECIES: hypothetical protein [Frankia]
MAVALAEGRVQLVAGDEGDRAAVPQDDGGGVARAEREAASEIVWPPPTAGSGSTR